MEVRHQSGVAGELDRIAKALLTTQEDSATAQILAVPKRLLILRLGLRGVIYFPAPFILLPPPLKPAQRQQNCSNLEMRHRMVGGQLDHSVKDRQRGLMFPRLAHGHAAAHPGIHIVRAQPHRLLEGLHRFGWPL